MKRTRPVSSASPKAPRRSASKPSPPRPSPDPPQSSRADELQPRLQAILQTAVEAIITIDEQGVIESVNPATERLFGYGAEEMLGQNVRMLMPSPYREQHPEYLERYRRTGEARIIGIGREALGQRKDGSVFPIDLAISEIRLANQKRLFTGFVRDITDRKAAEDQLHQMTRSLAEKNKELETVVYIASHDLRSPLVNIQGFSKELERICDEITTLVQETPGPDLPKAQLAPLLLEEVPEAIRFIKAGVAKIDRLLSGFLQFSRLGQAALHIRPIDMTALLAEITLSMEYQIQRAAARVTIEPLPPGLGDPIYVGQVFTNLLDNALKYLSPDRPPTIVVSGRQNAGQSTYCVRDNGIGIDPAHHHKIFEIFHRLDPVKTPGEGLGLSIAQRILERMGGRLWVESQPRQGSAFHVSLPSPPAT